MSDLTRWGLLPHTACRCSHRALDHRLLATERRTPCRACDCAEYQRAKDGTWQPCGDECHEMTDEHPAANQCNHCPPRVCEDCGGVNDLGADTMCACWIDLRTLAPADVKALFVADGWNVGTDGRLTR